MKMVIQMHLVLLLNQNQKNYSKYCVQLILVKIKVNIIPDAPPYAVSDPIVDEYLASSSLIACSTKKSNCPKYT
jgi:hypothetical protein